MEIIPEIKIKDRNDNKYGIKAVSLADISMQKLPEHHNPFEPHRLKFNLIIIIQDGPEGIHNIDLQAYTYQKNTALFIAKDQIHHFIDLPHKNNGVLGRKPNCRIA